MDKIETIQGSVIQHGPHNNRIYLMRLNISNTHALIPILDELAITNNYGKVFAKIPATEWKAFKSADYVKEAVVPGFYDGKIDGFFIAKYLFAERQITGDFEKPFRPVKKPGADVADHKHCTGGVAHNVIRCKTSDTAEMSVIYRRVFKSYPFPIQKPAYLERMMQEGVRYFCIRSEGRIAAIAAAEIDLASKNAEMTDFATVPECRGRGYAGMLLRYMDAKACDLGIKTVYTIARAASHGMNMVFQNSGYNYAGLLKNNSQICGSIQSMTVWYKHLTDHEKIFHPF